MVSRQQKRVLRYVEKGNLLKLKSYLRKHSELDVNFSHGKKKRSPLHMACSSKDYAILQLLLQHGADILQKDHKGDTPLHIAANKALKYGKRVYDDLVVPLQNHCQQAMNASNNAGITPQDLLQWMRCNEAPTNIHNMPESDAEKEWQQKLFGECQDEFFETFAQYDNNDFLTVDDEAEDFGDWAEQIRHEYISKRHAEAQRLAASSIGGRKRKTKEEAEQEAQSHRELHQRLQREHEEYLSRAARKAEETRQGKKQRYEQRCAATFQSDSSVSSGQLGYADIPWPAPQGTVKEMVEVMLHGSDRSDITVFRKILKRQQALWHPDKFAQRCGTRLEEKDKQRILDTVTALSQELNQLAQSLR